MCKNAKKEKDNSVYRQDVHTAYFCVYCAYTCKVIKSNSLNDGNTINQHHCQVIIK